MTDIQESFKKFIHSIILFIAIIISQPAGGLAQTSLRDNVPFLKVPTHCTILNTVEKMPVDGKGYDCMAHELFPHSMAAFSPIQTKVTIDQYRKMMCGTQITTVAM